MQIGARGDQTDHAGVFDSPSRRTSRVLPGKRARLLRRSVAADCVPLLLVSLLAPRARVQSSLAPRPRVIFVVSTLVTPLLRLAYVADIVSLPLGS